MKEDAGSPSAKQSLYPMGYGGIGLYPPSDVITWGADAITYMPPKLRQLTFVWGKGMLSNPAGEDSLYERIKGKNAEQIQAGDLEPESGKRLSSFLHTISPATIQVGGLKTNDDGFAKTDYLTKSPKNQGNLWDYKQIGEPDVKFLLTAKTTLE